MLFGELCNIVWGSYTLQAWCIKQHTIKCFWSLYHLNMLYTNCTQQAPFQYLIQGKWAKLCEILLGGEFLFFHWTSAFLLNYHNLLTLFITRGIANSNQEENFGYARPSPPLTIHFASTLPYKSVLTLSRGLGKVLQIHSHGHCVKG